MLVFKRELQCDQIDVFLESQVDHSEVMHIKASEVTRLNPFTYKFTAPGSAFRSKNCANFKLVARWRIKIHVATQKKMRIVLIETYWQQTCKFTEFT